MFLSPLPASNHSGDNLRRGRNRRKKKEEEDEEEANKYKKMMEKDQFIHKQF